MTSQASFELDVSLRRRSAVNVWETLKVLQGNTIFHLAGLAYKTESLGRSPEEQCIRDMVFRGY